MADRFDPGDLYDDDWVLWARLAAALVDEAGCSDDSAAMLWIERKSEGQ